MPMYSMGVVMPGTSPLSSRSVEFCSRGSNCKAARYLGQGSLQKGSCHNNGTNQGMKRQPGATSAANDKLLEQENRLQVPVCAAQGVPLTG